MKGDVNKTSGTNTSRDATFEQQSENTSSLDTFSVEDIPARILLLDQHSADHDLNLIVYHSGKWLLV